MNEIPRELISIHSWRKETLLNLITSFALKPAYLYLTWNQAIIFQRCLPQYYIRCAIIDERPPSQISYYLPVTIVFILPGNYEPPIPKIWISYAANNIASQERNFPHLIHLSYLTRIVWGLPSYESFLLISNASALCLFLYCYGICHGLLSRYFRLYFFYLRLFLPDDTISLFHTVESSHEQNSPLLKLAVDTSNKKILLSYSKHRWPIKQGHCKPYVKWVPIRSKTTPGCHALLPRLSIVFL